MPRTLKEKENHAYKLLSKGRTYTIESLSKSIGMTKNQIHYMFRKWRSKGVGSRVLKRRKIQGQRHFGYTLSLSRQLFEPNWDQDGNLDISDVVQVSRQITALEIDNEKNTEALRRVRKHLESIIKEIDSIVKESEFDAVSEG